MMQAKSLFIDINEEFRPFSGVQPGKLGLFEIFKLWDFDGDGCDQG